MQSCSGVSTLKVFAWLLLSSTTTGRLLVKPIAASRWQQEPDASAGPPGAAAGTRASAGPGEGAAAEAKPCLASLAAGRWLQASGAAPRSTLASSPSCQVKPLPGRRMVLGLWWLKQGASERAEGVQRLSVWQEQQKAGKERPKAAPAAWERPRKPACSAAKKIPSSIHQIFPMFGLYLLRW